MNPWLIAALVLLTFGFMGSVHMSTSTAPDINKLWEEFDSLFWKGFSKACLGKSDASERKRMTEIRTTLNELGVGIEFDGDNFYLVRKEKTNVLGN